MKKMKMPKMTMKTQRKKPKNRHQKVGSRSVRDSAARAPKLRSMFAGLSMGGSGALAAAAPPPAELAEAVALLAAGPVDAEAAAPAAGADFAALLAQLKREPPEADHPLLAAATGRDPALAGRVIITSSIVMQREHHLCRNFRRRAVEQLHQRLWSCRGECADLRRERLDEGGGQRLGRRVAHLSQHDVDIADVEVTAGHRRGRDPEKPKDAVDPCDVAQAALR